FSVAGRGRWRAALGQPTLRVAGRAVHVLNPLAPHHGTFRLRWEFERAPAADTDPSWSALAQPLRVLAPTTLCGAAALFIVLPLGLLTPLGVYAIVPAVALLYGSAIVGLIRLSRLRARGEIHVPRFAAFAFECLACPPFAANMLRRLTLAQRVPEP